MKIGKKLIISNITTNIIVMFVLSIFLSILISDYIKDDITKELLKENQRVVELFSYKKFLYLEDNKIVLSKDYKGYKEISSMDTIVFSFSNDNTLEDITKKFYDPKIMLSDEDLQIISSQDLTRTYNIIINNDRYIGYNDVVEINYEGKEFKLLVTTIISNREIMSVVSRIIIIIVGSIFLLITVTILINGYIGRKITKPIEKLKEITDKIAEKNYYEHADIDVSGEIGSLARSINFMAKSIRKYDSERKTFYENISHELKTPLTIISGYAEGLKTGIFEDEKKAYDTIIKESGFIKKRLEDIIYLSKLDSSSEKYEYKMTSINDLISAALYKLDSIIILKEIDILYEPIEDVLLNLDREKILKLLINIISNCLKYTKNIIEIKTNIENDKFIIKISDNGSGFPKEILSKPFDRAMIGDREGSGIGLSIAKRIADIHSAVIKLSNKKDGGAEYYIELPMDL